MVKRSTYLCWFVKKVEIDNLNKNLKEPALQRLGVSLFWNYLTKVRLVKATVFPVVMYECESWTVKKAECQRIDALLWYWRRLLRVPWTVRGSNQSILKEINPEYSWEGLLLKLKRQYFGHLMRRADSLQKIPIGKDGGQEERRVAEDEIVR